MENLVVLDQGRLVADQALAQFLQDSETPSVVVRCSRPEVLAAALEAAGLDVGRDEHGGLTVAGSTPDEIGRSRSTTTW